MVADGRARGAEGLTHDADRTQVSGRERRDRVGHAALVLVAKDAPLAYAIERELFDRGAIAAVARGASAIDGAVALEAAGLVAIVVADEADAASLASRAARVVPAASIADATRAFEANFDAKG